MKILFEKETIEKRIKEISTQIYNRHKIGKDVPIVMVCVLNGGFMFYSKLIDQLSHLDPECEFIKIKSYKGREHEAPEMIIPASLDVKNKFVYIIDDIYDSGITMDILRKQFTEKGAFGVNIVTLIKRSINEIDMPVGSLYGFEIHSEWVIGYGMDDEEGKKRSLPYILAI
jgi:hypoxanthine phosphoribosyltransferase